MFSHTRARGGGVFHYINFPATNLFAACWRSTFSFGSPEDWCAPWPWLLKRVTTPAKHTHNSEGNIENLYLLVSKIDIFWYCHTRHNKQKTLFFAYVHNYTKQMFFSDTQKHKRMCSNRKHKRIQSGTPKLFFVYRFVKFVNSRTELAAPVI